MADVTVWRAELRGETCDIEALMHFLAGPPRIETIEGRRWLIVSAAGCAEYEAARSEMDRTLTRLNALARTNTSDFRQVARGALQRVDATGRATFHAEAGFA
ncbi:MAG: hypothetical protein KKI08_07325, partial [Armatimonadetes bacterium]|nr:hypothetical protein [Armatimonadota bacterium]